MYPGGWGFDMTEPSIDTLLAHYELRVPVTVGRATISWNTLSQTVFQLYHSLSGMDLEAAKATFFVVASDRSQREMVSELVKTKLRPSFPDLAKRILSVLTEINTSLAGKRNDITHVIFLNEHSPANVAQFHERGYLKGKKGTELLDSIDKFAIDCLDTTIKLLKLTGEVSEQLHRRQAIVDALLQLHPKQTATEWSKGGVFGLLNVPDADPKDD